MTLSALRIFTAAPDQVDLAETCRGTRDRTRQIDPISGFSINKCAKTDVCDGREICEYTRYLRRLALNFALRVDVFD
jgi:hypothetical protein